MQVVVESLEETISKVHVSNWVNPFWEVNASWKLSIGMGPFVLNTFHVPLIDNNYYFLVSAFINLLKQILVSSINENTFKFWEIQISGLNKPVDLIRV